MTSFHATHNTHSRSREVAWHLQQLRVDDFLTFNFASMKIYAMEWKSFFIYMHKMLLTFDSSGLLTAHNLHHLHDDYILNSILSSSDVCHRVECHKPSSSSLFIVKTMLVVKHSRLEEMTKIPISRAARRCFNNDRWRLATFTPADNFIRTNHKQWLKLKLILF